MLQLKFYLKTFQTCSLLCVRVVQKIFFVKIYAANGFSRYMTLKNDIDKI